MTAHALAHHATAAGGSFVARRGRGRRRVIVPPSPRASAIVDPRIGDLGPALLALEDGTVFPGIAFGAPVAGGGDLVVNTSQTGYQEVCTDPSYAGQVVVMTYPAHRQLRSPRSTTTSRPTRGCARWSWPTRPRPCSTTPASSRRSCATTASRPSPASTRGRWPATCGRTAACAAIVTEPGVVDRADAVDRARAVPRWEDQDFVGQVSPSSIMDIGSHDEDGPLIGIVDFGLKSNIVRAMRRRGARVRILPHTISSRRRARARHRRR